jgi:Fe-S oxidoreductase
MLARAKSWLQDILEALGPEIEAGTPIIFLEPSCWAVFRDEMLNLFPDSVAAKRLSQQCFLLEDYLQRIDYEPPRLERHAIVHGHCHRKALDGMDATKQILEKMAVSATVLDDGCCGMAGSFGFEEGKYDVSVKVGEHGLLPRVRKAPETTLIIADGFSCREQIQQTTDRHGLHLAQVLSMALHDGPAGPSHGLPEAQYLQKPAAAGWRPVVAVAALAIGTALLMRRR